VAWLDAACRTLVQPLGVPVETYQMSRDPTLRKLVDNGIESDNR
jgi:hypothetical protein